MNLYKLLDHVKDALIDDGICLSVTSGDLSEAALNKKILYPYSHVTLGSASFPNNTIQYTIFVICMDLVDVNKESVVDQYRGNDNEHDAFNTTSIILARLVEKFRRGDLRASGFALVGTPSADPFYDEFTDRVAGWTMTMTVEVRNNMEAC